MPEEHHAVPAWTHNSWVQVFLFLTVQICGLIYFLANVKDSQVSLQGSVETLSHNVEKMGTEVARLAGSNERIDEHMRSLDRRLDLIEKEKQIEGYRRN